MSTQQYYKRAADTDLAEITVRPLGVVCGGRTEISDHAWAAETARIILDDKQFEADSTRGLKAFSHLEVVYYFHLSSRQRSGAVHPRSNPAWPRVGVFADRTPHRPNHLGVSRCELVSVSGLELTVRGLDAVDGTPVIDIKPYVEELGPHGPVREPSWIRELLASYY